MWHPFDEGETKRSGWRAISATQARHGTVEGGARRGGTS
jgi:hypothetical protein